MTRKDYVMLSEACGEYFTIGRPTPEAAGAAQLMVLIMLRLKADNKGFSIKQFIQNMALTIGGEDKLDEMMQLFGGSLEEIEKIESAL